MPMRKKVLAFISEAYRKASVYKEKKGYNAFVRDYYKKYKHKKFVFKRNIWSKNYFWDYFLQSLPHSMKSEYYIPADYYAFEIEPKLNTEFNCFCLEKNMFDRIFSNSGVKLPKTILRCINGLYLDENYKRVESAKDLCSCIREDIIVKPTVQACGGKGIRKYLFADNVLHLYDKRCHEFAIDEVTACYKGNFIIQQVVNQASEVAKFHPFSLNTVVQVGEDKQNTRYNSHVSHGN